MSISVKLAIAIVLAAGILTGCQTQRFGAPRAQDPAPAFKAAYETFGSGDERHTPCTISIVWLADLIRNGTLPGNLEIETYRCMEVSELSEGRWRVVGNLRSDIGPHDTVVDLDVGASEVVERKNKYGGETVQTKITPLRVVLDGIISHTPNR
ncbi:MAG: hypothetical protein JJ899_11250 [Alphaproteobacteria bacterium]|nr:hypothetical protein [Alphaproteobacteria bacterium]